MMPLTAVILFVTSFSGPVLAVHNGKSAINKGARAVIGFRGDENYFGCTGVVIHPRVILTAAHCAHLIHKGQINEVFFTSRDSTPTSIEVLDVHKHKNFVENFSQKDPVTGQYQSTIDYDIAVVTLKEPITNKNILGEIPRLPTADDLVAGPDAPPYVATGMGMYQTGGKNYLGDEKNSQKLSLKYFIRQVNLTVLILKSRVQDAGICQGDSGGGIFLDQSRDSNSPPVLVGIISAMTEFCGKRGEDNYAESVLPHIPFITESARQDGIEL